VHPAIIRTLLYPVYRALKRDQVLRYLADMREVQTMEQDRIREYQWDKLHRLLTYAYQHVPYYREVFKRLGAEAGDFHCPEDLRSLPLLTKQDIRANSKALISEIYPRTALRADSTGGSTGEKLNFHVGREMAEACRANLVRMNEWIGINLGDRMAVLWGTPFDVSGSRRLLNAMKNWFSNTLLLSAYRMDKRTLDSYLERLGKFRPHLLVGYPSALAHFSQAVIDTGRKPVHPKAVLVSGETLYDWQRQVIERAFSAKVYNHYGSREFGGLARECRLRHGMHLACERVFVETVAVNGNRGGDPVTELVISDLDNYGMPFIRYAIEDMGRVTWERCECGLRLPRLESAVGRTFDIVRSPNGNNLGGTFWTILLRKVEGVQRFQVIQERLDGLTIKIVPENGFSGRERDYITQKVHEACGEEMKVNYEIVDAIPMTEAGKHRFVISKIGLSNQSNSQGHRES
jgi:phenylacetate-CoA ligase